MLIVLIFMSQFASVFALVMNSKLLRDDRWVLAMLNSWLISATQFLFVWVVSQADSGERLITFLAAAAGGSIGCGVSHLVYTHKIMKRSV